MVCPFSIVFVLQASARHLPIHTHAETHIHAQPVPGRGGGIERDEIRQREGGREGCMLLC